MSTPNQSGTYDLAVTLTAKDEHCMSTSVLSLISIGVTVKVHVVDLEKEKVAPPTNGGAKVQVTGHRSGYRSQATGQVTGQITGHTQKHTQKHTQNCS